MCVESSVTPKGSAVGWLGFAWFDPGITGGITVYAYRERRMCVHMEGRAFLCAHAQNLDVWVPLNRGSLHTMHEGLLRFTAAVPLLCNRRAVLRSGWARKCRKGSGRRAASPRLRVTM